MMPFLKQLNKSESGKENKKVEFELPYFITIVTLLAASGFGPYTIFNKIREINLLPQLKLESEKIVNRIDILGMDPLTVMAQIKDKGISKSFGEFLNGYVSAIQSGGDVINYLKSKMNGAFENYESVQKESVEKVKALIDSYMTVQIVVLAVYLIITAIGSQDSANTSQGTEILYLVMILPPTISGAFTVISHKINKIRVNEVNWKKTAAFGIPGILVALVLILLDVFPDRHVYALAFALIIASVWPAIKFQKIHKFSLDSRSAITQILRDIAEARKAGLGPEKCVVRACKRKDYRSFNTMSNSIANKIEWGVPLKNIYNTLEREIKEFQILISFKILFEIISTGGGNIHTLGSLANISEKIQTIEKTKREMLKPYVMIGFIIVGITGFTTLLVIESLSSIGVQAEVDDKKKEALELQTKARFEILGFSIVSQAWLAGLFLGKITTGAYSGGFMLSIFLLLLTVAAIFIIQQGLFSVSSIFGTI